MLLVCSLKSVTFTEIFTEICQNSDNCGKFQKIVGGKYFFKNVRIIVEFLILPNLAEKNEGSRREPCFGRVSVPDHRPDGSSSEGRLCANLHAVVAAITRSDIEMVYFSK